jgi:hypothetical protein
MPTYEPPLPFFGVCALLYSIVTFLHHVGESPTRSEFVLPDAFKKICFYSYFPFWNRLVNEIYKKINKEIKKENKTIG